MEQTKHYREFIRYTTFSVLGTLGVSCYILADTFFISKGLGADGLTALNLAIPVYNFVHGVGMMLGMGGATRFSVCKSQDRKDEVNRIYTNTVFFALLFSIVFVLLGMFFSKELALLLGADAAVLEMTDTYLRWLLLFTPAFILNNILLCFVRNDEGPQLSMFAMLWGSFANIIFDYIFIFPMGLGILGAILATGVSPVISMLIMLSHWMKKRNTFHFVKAGLAAGILKRTLPLGFPAFITQISAGIVMIAFNRIILRLEGNTGVAAYGVVANIAIVIVAIYTGISQGAQPLISNYYGKGSNREVHEILRYAMVTTLSLSGVLYLLLFLFARPVTAVFNSEGNAALQRIAVSGLKLYFTAIPFAGYNIILAVFFTSVEKALPAQVLSILRGFFLILPMAFLLSALWGMTGVWLAYPITEGLVAMLGRGIYKRKK